MTDESKKGEAEAVRRVLAEAPNCRAVRDAKATTAFLLPKDSLARVKAALKKNR